jgi:hypothetical protein
MSLGQAFAIGKIVKQTLAECKKDEISDAANHFKADLIHTAVAINP